MHWDPGTYFDWAHFMALVGAPITPKGADKTGRIVTIDPKFKTNRPPVSACDSSGAAPAAGAARELPLPAHGAERVRAVRRRSVPRRAWARRARRTGATRPSPASRSRSPSAQGDWLAIWYGGQKAWLYDPKGKNTIPGGGTLVTPKAGLASIPVYGRAYPSSVSTATLGYTIPAGQTYVAKDLVGADYYSASTYNAPETYSVVKSDEQFYEISFNHRIAFVRATDVDTVS